MAGNTTNFASILTPEQVADLVVRPLISESIAGQVMTAVTTSSREYRIPVVTQDPSASWTAEGAEINVSDAAVDEVNVIPSKLAALSIITRELANDSSPAAAEVVGQGIVRDLVRKVDAALFAASTTNGPAGIAGLSGISTVDAGASYANVDAFSDALFTAAASNGVISAWVTNPATAKALSKVKEATGSNKPLLGPDPTVPGRRQILGVPLLTSPAVATAGNVVWGISAAYSYLVIREDAEVESDRSVFFTSDRVAIRATLRLGFGFPAPATVVKITTA
jgi:HK97 family phage major capsid protein